MPTPMPMPAGSSWKSSPRRCASSAATSAPTPAVSRTTGNAASPARRSPPRSWNPRLNQVISKRMVKKQQMRWSPRGAHLLLQIRTRVLNDTLTDDYRRWYPAFTHTPDPLNQEAGSSAERGWALCLRPRSEPVSVYQVRVVVRGISPLIWRRLLIPADTTIAGLHMALQVAFGWSGEHLHRFVIHGSEYGISYLGGVGFRDDPHRVRVAELGLRPTERFTYHYDFTAGWCLDLRVEQILLLTGPGRSAAVCTGGRRAGPPEDCGGVWAFLERTQPHLVWAARIRPAHILGMLRDEDEDEDEDGATRFSEHRDELAGLLPLLGLERFDRPTLNRALAAQVETEAGAQ